LAKRRRVGNILALAVLATIVQRPMHPYEIASVLRARGKENDMPIKWGSLYTVVANTGSMAGVDAWRAWHATGELPPEVEEIARRGSD
jgi:hypothetical protein